MSRLDENLKMIRKRQQMEAMKMEIVEILGDDPLDWLGCSLVEMVECVERDLADGSTNDSIALREVLSKSKGVL